MTKVCPVCGKEFETVHDWKRMCDGCYAEKKTREITCPICGETFYSQSPVAKYCSYACRREGKLRYQRDWKRKHPKYSTKWNHEHLEQSRLIKRRYYKNHQKECVEQSKKYYNTHIDERRAYARNHYYENRDSILERKRYEYNVAPKIEACRAKHNNCFDCPTKDGECLYE